MQRVHTTRAVSHAVGRRGLSEIVIVRLRHLLVIVLAAATTLAGSIPLIQPLATPSVVDAAVRESAPPDEASGTLLNVEAETEEEEEQGSRRLHLAATTALTLGLLAPCGGCWHHRRVTRVPSRTTACLSRGPPVAG